MHCVHLVGTLQARKGIQKHAHGLRASRGGGGSVEDGMLDDLSHDSVDLFDRRLRAILGEFGELRLLFVARSTRGLSESRFDLFELAAEIEELFGGKIAIGDGGRRREGADPVLVPKQIKKTAIQ